MLRRLAIIGLVMSGFLAMASASSALTLGNTTLPSGSNTASCPIGNLFWQSTTDSSYNYAVPAGGGTVTSWSINTAGDVPGVSVTFVVIRPGSSNSVVGTDTETLPNPLPAVATFTLAHPITVAPGDTLGLWSPGSAVCLFSDGPLTTSDVVIEATAATAPSAGNLYSSNANPALVLMNVSANLVQTQDVALTGVAAPASVTTGSGAAYGFTVTNAGPGTRDITFTDAVPFGLKIIAAAADSGTCTTTGQTVTCTISGLPPGGTSPVWIVVSAASAGTYPDSASVTTSLSDPTPANSSATATLTVTAPPVAPPPSCKTINLAGVPLAAAKSVIRALNCTVGKTPKKSSKKIHKGFVISTIPGPGKTLANGTKVNIVVSSGPPKKKHKKKK
ncbi:MAG: hypothetical protein QOJ25_2016 [Solirubrobacteraceae bacterium]|jgi:hypothetical protein|nr:hypothetical protein [Solirubrobacteraceae bacterium]